MEGRYGMYRQGSSGWASMRNEEFEEDDIWDVLEERKEYNSKVGTSKESSIFTPRALPSAARMIPRPYNNPNNEPKMVQQSAPVNIPDWSKIYGKHSKKALENSAWLDYDGDVGDDGDGADAYIGESWDSDEDEGGDGTMMPPHEWIAKKLARSQISSFSVCEGVGRTLKGRDLSRVRNAVLTKTGFLE